MGELNAEDPNCAATWASFRLVGDKLNPAEVTRRTGITPDLGRARGEVWAYPSGRNFTQGTGVWLIDSKPRVTSTSLEHHLSYLLSVIEPVRDALLAVVEDFDADADFYCLWESAEGEGGPVISSDTVGRIARLNAAIGIVLTPPDADGDQTARTS